MTYTTIIAGEVEERPVKFAKAKPTLEEMQAIVGGYIERVTIPGGELWVNEEGRLKKLPINPLASELANQLIVGNVLVARRAKPARKGAGPPFCELRSPGGRKCGKPATLRVWSKLSPGAPRAACTACFNVNRHVLTLTDPRAEGERMADAVTIGGKLRDPREAPKVANCDVCDKRPGTRSVMACGTETWVCDECSEGGKK